MAHTKQGGSNAAPGGRYHALGHCDVGGARAGASHGTGIRFLELYSVMPLSLGYMVEGLLRLLIVRCRWREGVGH